MIIGLQTTSFFRDRQTTLHNESCETTNTKHNAVLNLPLNLDALDLHIHACGHRLWMQENTLQIKSTNLYRTLFFSYTRLKKKIG